MILEMALVQKINFKSRKKGRRKKIVFMKGFQASKAQFFLKGKYDFDNAL